MCVDAAAFRASVETLTNLKLAQVGTAGLKTALDAVQTSAQALLSSGKDLVGPPITDLLTAVQGLQTTIAGLGDQPTLGAKLVSVQGSIAQIKTAAANVDTALGASCPTQ